MIPETPPKYYWAQCYEIGKRTHWALRDTHTDAQGQPERVSSYDMVLWAHRSKDIAESPIPKLIAQLLTDHYAKQPPLAETPYSVDFLHGGVWCCTEKSQCQWQGFALHQGLAWGTTNGPTREWRDLHDVNCRGRLIQLIPPQS